MPQATNHPTLNSNIKTKFAKNENEVSFGSEIASECEKTIDTYRGCIFIFFFYKFFHPKKNYLHESNKFYTTLF